jgi:hypothetical protein
VVATALLATVTQSSRPGFRTKLELAVELPRWAKPWLALTKLPICVVADHVSTLSELDFCRH